MNVNQKGVRGLIKTIDYFSELGWYCFPAFDDHSPVDLIVMSPSGQTLRLQVKYRELDKQELNEGRRKYLLQLFTVVSGKQSPINRNLIDGWAIYCKNDNVVKLVSVNDVVGIRCSTLISIDKQYSLIV